jgi:hypothetical protein
MVDGFDKGLDVSLAAEDERRRRDDGFVGGRWGIVVRVDGDAGWIVASVLQTPEAIEEHLQNVAPLLLHIEIQIRKYPTHSSFLSLSLSLSSFFFFFFLLLDSRWHFSLIYLNKGEREGEGWTNRQIGLSDFLFLYAYILVMCLTLHMHIHGGLLLSFSFT